MGHHFFSKFQAAKTGITAIIDSRPRLEQDQHVLPLQQLNMNQDLLSFDLEITEVAEPEMALSVLRVPADIWHRRMGHINSQSLKILRDAGDNGINYSDSMSPYDVCAFGKSKQQRHPKTATHTTDRPFQLVYTNFLGPISPTALGGFRLPQQVRGPAQQVERGTSRRRKIRCGKHSQTVRPDCGHSTRPEYRASLH